MRRIRGRHDEIQPAVRQEAEAPQLQRLTRRGQVADHRGPEDHLKDDRDIAHDLDIDQRDALQEPVARDPHDADQKAQHRRNDDPRGRDRQRVHQADDQCPAIGIARGIVDQRLADLELRDLIEEAKAGGDVLAAEVLDHVLIEIEAQQRDPDRQCGLIDHGAHRFAVKKILEAPRGGGFRCGRGWLSSCVVPDDGLVSRSSAAAGATEDARPVVPLIAIGKP